MKIALALSLSLGAALTGLLAAPVVSHAEPARAEIPIKAILQSDGEMRFSIPVTVGGQTIEAELDTGSSGLRLMPSGLPPGAVTASGRPSREVYGSGVRLIGNLADIPVTIGGVSATVPVELTTRIECVEEKPRCPASRLPQNAYRIGGNGRAGAGFLAIVGIGMRPADAANPVSHMGTGRWIVILPTPSAPNSGMLVINPSPEETQGYQTYHLEGGRKADAAGGPTWRDNQLKLCLTNLDRKVSVCGPSMLDSGAPNFHFALNQEPLPDWTKGTHAAIDFALDGDKSLSAPFTVESMAGTRVHYSRPTTEHFAEGLNAGFFPFYAFSVLYDAKAGTIGVKARNPAPITPAPAP